MFQKEYWERNKLEQRRAPGHPVIKEYVLSKIQRIKKKIPLDHHTTLLDVGCGNGFFTYYWQEICQAIGVDFSGKMLLLNPVNKKAQMDANQLAFKDNSFDIVFCHALLHHVADINQVVNEMTRVSKKYIVILEPNRANPLMFLFSFLVKEERQALKFSRKYLKRILTNHALQVLDVFSLGLIVPNKTPRFLLPLLKLLHFKQPWGMTTFIIASKIKTG